MTMVRIGHYKYFSLVLILGAAILIRLSFLAFFGNTLHLQTSGYDTYAVNLIDGHGYTRFSDYHQDSDVPPLYSFFLVGVYLVLGRNPISVALVQIALDTITFVMIYRIGQRIAGKAVGLVTAAMTAFYPYLLFQNLTVNDTALFIALLSSSIWAVFLAYDRKSWRCALLAGMLLGLAALTKSLVALMVPLIFLWWLRHLGWRPVWKLVAAFVVAFVLVPLPWVIRNIQLQHTFVLISLNDGSNLLQGNNPLAADLLLQGYDVQWTLYSLPQIPDGLTEVQQANWYRDQALDYLRTHSSDWPKLFGAKFLTLWSPELRPIKAPPEAHTVETPVLQYEQPMFQVARVIHVIYFTPLLVLGILGMLLSWRDKRLIGPLIIVLVAVTIAYLIYHPSTRYRSPADPFLFCMSAYALVRIYEALKTKVSGRQFLFRKVNVHATNRPNL